MQITLKDVIRLTYGTNGVYHLESTYNLDKVLKENNYLKCVKPVIRSLAHFNNQTEWIANPCKRLEASKIPDYKSACEVIIPLKEKAESISCENIRIRKLDVVSEEAKCYLNKKELSELKHDMLYLVEGVLPNETVWLHIVNVLYGSIWCYQKQSLHAPFLTTNTACCVYDEIERYVNQQE